MGKTLFIFSAVFVVFLVRMQFLPKLSLTDGQWVRVSGILAEEPQVSGNQQKFKLGQFEIVTEKYPEYHYGDEVEVIGKVKTKLTTLNLLLSSFNYPLTSPKTYFLDYPTIEKKSAGIGIKSIKGRAIWLRVKLLDIYKRIFPRPLDGIVSGIVLGDKSMISKDFWQKLQQTGTLHIMVASGMNIAMFSQGLLEFFLLFFKRRLAICCLIVVIWFYSIMTGLTPPMVRAATMASLIYLGGIVGRETEGGRVLFITGSLMVFGNPTLIFDVGFQLSFMATVGLVWIQPRLKGNDNDALSSRARSETTSRGIPLKNTKGFLHALRLVGMTIIKSDNFSSSVAATLATLPILVTVFGRLNILSPFINLIILWTIPFILQLGMALGLLGLLWIKLADLASYLVYPLLFFLEQSINLFAKIKIFQLELPGLGIWWAIGYYFILWLWIRGLDSRR